MTEPTLVNTAALAPGECALSGDFNGPFLDTGLWLNGYGRVYLSLKTLGPLMREAGWVPRDEVRHELEKSEKFLAEAEDLRDRAERGDALLAAIQPLIPEPEPVVKQVALYKDDRIRLENENLVAINSALREEIAELRLADANPPQTNDSAAPAPEGEGSSSEPEPADPATTGTIEVEGQEVDLDALLSRTVQDIKDVAEGKPAEFAHALAVRELELAERDQRKARKMVLALSEDS